MGMNIPGKSKFSLTVISLFFAATLIAAGCSGGGGGSPTAGEDNGTSAGKATISGTIDVSSLSSSDSAKLGKAMFKRLAKANKLSRQAYSEVDYTADAVVKLYTVGENGDLEDTGLSSELSTDDDGNPTFEFEGVEDGVNYVIRYVKLVGDGQVLELKAHAMVPEGETAPASAIEVSPQTTVIIETLVNAIIEATQGTGIDQTIVNNIITAVKTAIESLVASGVIQIPSMVVAADITTLDDIDSASIENEDMANAAGLILSDTSVDSELGVVKTETKATMFNLADVTTVDAKRELINRVFDELLGDDDDVPSFMIEFLGDIYVQNKTVTVGQMVEAIGLGLRFPPELSLPGITRSDAIDAFKTELTDIYSLINKKQQGTLLSDSEKQKLAEIPPVILGLFPISAQAVWTQLTEETLLNVPQAIAMTIYIVDVYLYDTFEELEATYDATSSSGDAGMEVKREDPFEFNPMEPGSIMQLLGFYEVADQYAGLDIFDLWMHPGKAWIPDNPDDPSQGGNEVDMLNAGVCIGDVASMVAMFTEGPGAASSDLSTAEVTLTYPRKDPATGTVTPETVDLIDESTLFEMGGPGGFGESCFILDPWREAQAQNPDNPPDKPINPDPARIVSYFTSGTYTVTVVYNGSTYTKSFSKKVITGMTNVYPTLITPRGFPNWPGDAASQAQKDAFQQAMEEFNQEGSTRFSANVDTTGPEGIPDGINDAAQVTITWTAPVVTLPAGVKMGYYLDIGKGGCDQNGCTWQHIFSTWEKDKILFTTSFNLPVPLPELDVADTRSYHLNVGVVFIDVETGEQLGQGGNAHAEFRVAEPIDMDTTFTITGAAANDYKVVLFRETYDSENWLDPYKRTPVQSVDVVNGTYTLTPTLGNFLEGGGPGDWYNIVMYQDPDNDGYEKSDPQWWSAPGDGIWFSTWGKTLRVTREICGENWTNCSRTETIIIGGETINGPTFTAPQTIF